MLWRCWVCSSQTNQVFGFQISALIKIPLAFVFCWLLRLLIRITGGAGAHPSSQKYHLIPPILKCKPMIVPTHLVVKENPPPTRRPCWTRLKQHRSVFTSCQNKIIHIIIKVWGDRWLQVGIVSNSHKLLERWLQSCWSHDLRRPA